MPICKPKCGQFSKCTKSIPPTPNRCQCITGYAENKKTADCEPICKNKCVNGLCIAPDTCSCFEGYELDTKNKTLCKPKCNPACPTFSSCVTPNNCQCNKDYKKNENINKCEPVCTQMVENSKCIKPPNIWECNSDYQHDLKIDKCVLESCNCQSNGYCLENKDKCICYDGFTKNATNGQCEPICQPECKNSLCVENNVCECFDYYHKTREDHICEHNNLCNGAPCENGECTRMGECICKQGFFKSLSYEGHIQCDKESTFVAKIMGTVIVIPLFLASCILVVVCIIAKKKSYNIEEQGEIRMIKNHNSIFITYICMYLCIHINLYAIYFFLFRNDVDS